MNIREYIADGQKSLKELKENCSNAVKVSEELLMNIIKDNKDTEFGIENNFSDIKSIKDYKEKVPFSTYSAYDGRIKRMMKGEKNLLTVYPVVHYAKTSGSIGVPKSIPVSENTLKLYDKYTIKMVAAICDEYLKKTKNRELYNGKLITTVISKCSVTDSKATYGAVSAAHYRYIKKDMEDIWGIPDFCIYTDEEFDYLFVKALFALKNSQIVGLDGPFSTALYDFFYYIKRNWNVLCEAIRLGDIPSDIDMPEHVRKEICSVLQPDEKRAEELTAVFEAGFDTPVVKRIWPHFEYVNCIGAATFGAYIDKLKEYIGDIPISNYVYTSSEALMAVVTCMNSTEYTLIPEAGYFEFIPADSDVEDMASLQTQTLNLNELEVGKDYEIIITNLSGLYRYMIGDVITVLGYEGESPKIRFKYRTSQTINMAGEKTSMVCITDAIEHLEKEMNITIPDYSIYADYDSDPGRYILLMESNEHVEKEQYKRIEGILEARLEKNNPSYGNKVKTGVLLPLSIDFVQKDTYWLYRDIMVYRGTSQNQIKPVRMIDNPFKKRFFFGLIDKE